MPGSYYFIDMLKKIFFYLLIGVTSQHSFAQVLYSERFNNLTLNTGTYTANSTTQSYLYNDISNGAFTINSGSLTADTLIGNYPFRANGQKQKAWLTYRPAAINNTTDTFAVSTSWLNPAGTANAWLITPTINNIDTNSVLTWNAIAPDAANSDGYSVYVTTNTISPSPATSDFSTALFSVTTENNAWTNRGISLAAYAGKNIRIAFRNNSTNKYQLWLDDIIVENATHKFDMAAVSNDVYKYSTKNINNTMMATFKNNGYTPVTSVTVKYQIGTNTPITEIQNFSTPVNYLNTKQIGFFTPFISGTAGYYTYKIWVDKINGKSDQLNANDTVTGAITLSNENVAKKLLVEEYTGVTYGWAPENYEALKSIAATNTNVIITSIHADDSMSTNEGNSLISDYANTLPSASIDQYYFAGKNEVSLQKYNWNSSITQRQSMKVPVSVAVTNATYNPTSRQIDATVEASFVGEVRGDYRLNLYVIENNVYGPITDNSDNDWNQYSYLYNAPTSPYYQVGNYLNNSTYLMNPTDFKHQHVLTHMAGGAYGTNGVIPSNTITTNQTYTMSYSYVLPTCTNNGFRYNPDNIYLIGLVTEYDANTQRRAVLNAAQVKLNPNNAEIQVGINDVSRNTVEVGLYPNPTSDYCTLNYNLSEAQNVSVSIYNTLGELVSMESLNTTPGNVSHRLNVSHLPQGSYTIVVALKNSSVSKKLTIIK